MLSNNWAKFTVLMNHLTFANFAVVAILLYEVLHKNQQLIE